MQPKATPPISRRACLRLLGASALAGIARGAPGGDAAQKGRGFLAGIFDEELSLLPEFAGAQVFWLFHDNYLAAKVLASSHPKTAARIGEALRREGIRESGKIEIVFGEARAPLPLRHHELREVRRVGARQLRTEVATDRPIVDWENYADLLLLALLAERGKPAAREHWQAAMRLWDGRGFADVVAKKAGIYATYKLALALLAASRLSPAVQPPAGMIEQLMSRQDRAGGWITDYDAAGGNHGVANVETTCLAILGIEAEGARG